MERILLSRPVREPGAGAGRDASTFDAAVARAAAVLNAGGVAILPAEGLYGLHARPDLPEALGRLQAIKPREGGRGWIGLIAVPEDIARLADPPVDRALSLARRHWPGALTLVVRASSRTPQSLVAADGTVALRCPGSDFLRAVAEACGGVLLSTSANAPGAAPPATAAGLDEGRADLLVDAGPLSGVPSTVARVEGEDVRVLREGAVRLGEPPLDGPGTPP
ncbi:MAG: L-threonylcarbamoyladenylate synthase [Candidatus Eiseniibacteriota bacterium]